MSIQKRRYNRTTNETLGDILKGVVVISIGVASINMGAWVKKELNQYPIVQNHNEQSLELRTATMNDFKEVASRGFEKTFPYSLMLVGGLLTLKGAGYTTNLTYRL